jgi:putative FmdB family regulatory protein
MPVYEYVCSACGHRLDIIHGHNETGPHFCPECGTQGSMRKAFAPPTIVFKGSGWAKKERRSTSTGSSGSSRSDEPETKSGSKETAPATAEKPKADSTGSSGSSGSSGD